MVPGRIISFSGNLDGPVKAAVFGPSISIPSTFAASFHPSNLPVHLPGRVSIVSTTTTFALEVLSDDYDS